ncbi:MAG: aquaporin family protein [Massilibacteroides sp.]|nr:aquaporin family protein [Massilibacteroides sp.]MDD3061945.1 aquaporin family protein [Massilibacteroides sp.]MDD4115760.1 aquaporin family protein [Massilibacteroides sp.]MDD4659926.1 aquaporin family protein [Massilibacteroides sp.]
MGQDLIFEFIGTAILILLGDGVVANVILKGTKGYNSGWVVISIAWGLAVFVAAFISGPYSGAHLNPALTVGLALVGQFDGNVIGYIVAQILGGIVGAMLVYLFYKPHFDAEEDSTTKLGVFCTIPAIRNYTYNFISEVIGTFLLVFGILYAAGAQIDGPYPVALLIVAIGMSLGGTTGYAINPARDLGPRIAHALLPIKGKRDSDWAYSWIPVLGPFTGAVLAAGLFVLLH